MNAWACEVHEHVNIKYNLSKVMTNEYIGLWI